MLVRCSEGHDHPADLYYMSGSENIYKGKCAKLGVYFEVTEKKPDPNEGEVALAEYSITTWTLTPENPGEADEWATDAPDFDTEPAEGA